MSPVTIARQETKDQVTILAPLRAESKKTMPSIHRVAYRCPHNFPLTKQPWRKSSACSFRSRDGVLFTGVGRVFSSFSFVIIYSNNSKRVRKRMPATQTLVSRD